MALRIISHEANEAKIFVDDVIGGSKKNIWYGKIFDPIKNALFPPTLMHSTSSNIEKNWYR